MKRIGKILLFVLGGLVLTIAAAVVFHDPLISYFIKAIIKDKSEGKVVLEIAHFDLDFKTGDILIDKPILTFEEVYMNENKSIKINSLSFDKLLLKA